MWKNVNRAGALYRHLSHTVRPRVEVGTRSPLLGHVPLSIGNSSRLVARNLCAGLALNGCKTFNLDVKPFGQIYLKTEGPVLTRVGPIDPQKYPLQNKLFVVVESADGLDLDSVVSVTDAAQREAEAEYPGLLISASLPDGSQTLTCDVRVPIKYDIDAKVRGHGEIAVEKLENDTITIHIDKGVSRLHNIQTATAVVESDGGDVLCDGLLQGNSSIKTAGTGKIEVHRIQGLTFEAVTDKGDIKAKAVYADSSSFSTSNGDVHIGSCHRDVSVTVKDMGSVYMESLDGDLDVDVARGNISLGYIARHGTVNLHTPEGEIDIKLPEDVKTWVNLKATEVTFDGDLDTMDLDTEKTSDGGSFCKGMLLGGTAEADSSPLAVDRHITASGATIRVSQADWFSSLNLVTQTDD